MDDELLVLDTCLEDSRIQNVFETKIKDHGFIKMDRRFKYHVHICIKYYCQ